MKTPSVPDVVIVGGGLTGLACALALSGDHLSSPLNVVVIDAGPSYTERDFSRDPRGSAITSGSRAMLEAIGIWQIISKQAQPFTRIKVTDSDDTIQSRPALLSFLSDHDECTVSAWMLENSVIMQALVMKILAAPNICVMTDTKVTGQKIQANSAEITLSTGQTLRTSLVVAADGKASYMRQTAGIDVIGWDYGQSGIAMTIAHEKPHEGCAEEYFRKAGPFAVLPLTGNRSSIVWTENTVTAEWLMTLPKEEFLAEFKTRLGNHLGEIQIMSQYASWPLSFQLAKQFTASRLALIGDAAHIVHPIAGLGFNLGLKDIAALTECVMEQVRLGLDYGGQSALDTYEQWRRMDTIMIAAACDGLNRLFSNDNTPLISIRRAGLKLVDQARPVKSFFMDRAAGTTGRQPKLMSGEPL
ncbi:MAG: FAD-dependent monooxygenase [Anderseniella sp.]